MAGTTRSARPTASSAALIVLDGLGDRPTPALNGRSPVDVAATPNLDRLSGRGEVGEVSILGPGVAPESDAGVLALLGYDPEHDSPGRGILEALGVEIPLRPGDIALRLNFATIDATGRVLDARVGRSLSTAESTGLARSLSEADLLGPLGIRAEVRATVGHRGVLWLRPRADGPLSPNVSNADPFYERVGGLGKAKAAPEPKVETVRPLDASPAARRAAEALNAFLVRVPALLDADPINVARRARGALPASGLLVRNAGGLPEPGPVGFAERHGISAAAVTEMPVERGIARLLGLQDRFVGPMGSDRPAGYRERAMVTRDLLGSVPLVYVHLKGPDEPGHDGDADRKRAVVEEIDRAFFGPLLEGLDLERTAIAVTADHATPCVLRGHSDDPVPWLLVGGGAAGPGRPGPLRFGGPAPAGGFPVRLRSSEVLPRLLRAAGLGPTA